MIRQPWPGHNPSQEAHSLRSSTQSPGSEQHRSLLEMAAGISHI